MPRRLVASVVLASVACLGMLGLALGLGWSPRLGLDLRGGLSVVYKPISSTPVTSATLQTVVNIMTERVSADGVSQPNISTQGGDVVVQIPGVSDPNTLLKELGTTAQLYFRPVLCGAPAYIAPTNAKGKVIANTYHVPPTCPSPYSYTSAYFNSSTSNYEPPDADIEDPSLASYLSTPAGKDSSYQKQNVLFSSNGGISPRYVLGPVLASGTIIKSAYASLGTNGEWTVVFTLTSSGSTVFNHIASAHYDELVANDLDGQIVSAPVIESTSFPGSGQISGNFTQTTADQLAQYLSYGALPVQLQPQTTETVSPSLGASSLHAGILAGLLGLLLVMGYMIVYYRALGIVVVLGLATTAAFLYGFIAALGRSSLGLTLDLSGVTGLIVSVGITVDSYVVYFERLKDEVRAGRSIRSAVDRGFKSAYRTILSADAVSFIGALVLWLLSIGAVRGFAFMLGLSTLVDVVTAYVFTRPFVILLGRNRVFTEAKHLGVARGLAAAQERL